MNHITNNIKTVYNGDDEYKIRIMNSDGVTTNYIRITDIEFTQILMICQKDYHKKDSFWQRIKKFSSC